MTTDTIETALDADISERVRTIIATFVTPGPDRPSDIDEQKRLIEDLGADSLDCVSLILAVEDEFGIEISDDQFGEVVTVVDVVNLVQAQLAEFAR